MSIQMYDKRQTHIWFPWLQSIAPVAKRGKTLSRKLEGGEGGVTHALLRSVTTL